MNGQKVIVIESEGGNDNEVPSELPPLVNVEQRKRTIVGKPPVKLRNDEVVFAKKLHSRYVSFRLFLLTLKLGNKSE
ncbi:hypothetical protein M0R45_019320 [Rubus argutus]|uniref:Uncharacterized protein n=1 Tax=Rubus argutus TaxID=59490 RepID=A0AAW1X8R0_RUBAR